jgi:hypothetical protein
MARPHRYAKRCGREFWSTGVLRIVGIAPRARGVGSAFQGQTGDSGLMCAGAIVQIQAIMIEKDL